MLRVESFSRAHLFYYFVSIANGNGIGIDEPGSWLEASKRVLGVDGEVSHSQLADLVEGINPDTFSCLDQRAAKRKIGHFDLVFAAPKSVSILALCAGDEIYSKVLDAHESSVEKALNWAGRHAVSVAGPIPGDEHNVSSTGILGAQFIHRTSRKNDPHLHSHIVMPNLAQGVDGHWGSARTRQLFLNSRYVGEIYQCHLREKMTKDLGVNWTRFRNGVADLQGIGPEVIRNFSKRSQEITRLLNHPLSAQNDLKFAALNSRPEKDLTKTVESLRPMWQDQLAKLGVPHETLLKNTLEKEQNRPANHLLALLGEIPSDKEQAKNWHNLAKAIDEYREKWGLQNSVLPLGPSCLELAKETSNSVSRLSDLMKIEHDISARQWLRINEIEHFRGF